jgi:cardiolipin synthase A/B
MSRNKDHYPYDELDKKETNTSYRVISDIDALLVDIEREIHRATLSIKMQFLSYEADHVGQCISNALLRAAKRGIEVRLLVDYYTDLYHQDKLIHIPRLKNTIRQKLLREWQTTQVVFRTMQENGIQVKRTNPMGFLFHKFLWRDHKKLVIIDADTKDHQLAYVGGFNAADHHAAWHDFMVKMQGGIVKHLNDDFDRTWSGTNPARRVYYGDGFLLTDSVGKSLIFEATQQIIEQAERRVILESPYVYGHTVQRTLINAVERGVKVSLIVPLDNNRHICVLTQRSLRQLSKSGVCVYHYKNHDGMTHAKVLLADEVAVFGSSNFNQFLAGRLAELSIVSRNPALVSQLEVMLNDDIGNSVLF